MNINSATKLPYLVIAAALGAIAGAVSVLLARRESREYIRERGARGVEYLNQASAKLRDRTEAIVGKGRELMSCCAAKSETASEQTAHSGQEDKQEMH